MIQPKECRRSEALFPAIRVASRDIHMQGPGGPSCQMKSVLELFRQALRPREDLPRNTFSDHRHRSEAFQMRRSKTKVVLYARKRAAKPIPIQSRRPSKAYLLQSVKGPPYTIAYCAPRRCSSTSVRIEVLVCHKSPSKLLFDVSQLPHLAQPGPRLGKRVFEF
jgi:hypothetical protein